MLVIRFAAIALAGDFVITNARLCTSKMPSLSLRSLRSDGSEVELCAMVSAMAGGQELHNAPNMLVSALGLGPSVSVSIAQA